MNLYQFPMIEREKLLMTIDYFISYLHISDYKDCRNEE